MVWCRRACQIAKWMREAINIVKVCDLEMLSVYCSETARIKMMTTKTTTAKTITMKTSRKKKTRKKQRQR